MKQISKNSKKRHNKVVGNLGEDIACKFLMKHGFEVIQRNYLKKWGEIDIITKKEGLIHFIEVKTVSRERVIRETNNAIFDVHKPEDNVNKAKLRRISRVIQSYLSENESKCLDFAWKFDLVTVFLNKTTRSAKVFFHPNLIIGS